MKKVSREEFLKTHVVRWNVFAMKRVKIDQPFVDVMPDVDFQRSGYDKGSGDEGSQDVETFSTLEEALAFAREEAREKIRLRIAEVKEMAAKIDTPLKRLFYMERRPRGESLKEAFERLKKHVDYMESRLSGGVDWAISVEELPEQVNIQEPPKVGTKIFRINGDAFGTSFMGESLSVFTVVDVRPFFHLSPSGGYHVLFTVDLVSDGTRKRPSPQPGVSIDLDGHRHENHSLFDLGKRDENGSFTSPYSNVKYFDDDVVACVFLDKIQTKIAGDIERLKKEVTAK